MKDLSLAELIIQHGSETRAANEYVELVGNRNMVEQITNSAKQNESEAIIRNAPEGATEIWFGETESVGDYAKRAPSGEWLLYDVGDKRWYDASLADVQWRSHHNLSDLKKDRAAARALALFVSKANTKEDVLSTVKSLAHKLQMKQWHIENLMEQNDDCQVIDARDAKDVLNEACEQIGSLANQREALRDALNQAIELNLDDNAPRISSGRWSVKQSSNAGDGAILIREGASQEYAQINPAFDAQFMAAAGNAGVTAQSKGLDPLVVISAAHAIIEATEELEQFEQRVAASIAPDTPHREEA